MITWLENHLLPCAYKAVLGIDCPVCGFQRAFLCLLQGKFGESFKMYPPLIPCLLFIVIAGIYFMKRTTVKPALIKVSSYSILSIIFVNYFIKMSLLLFS